MNRNVFAQQRAGRYLFSTVSSVQSRGGCRGKFPGPGSQEGPAKSLIQTEELNNILVGLKPPLAPNPAQGPLLFIALCVIMGFHSFQASAKRLDFSLDFSLYKNLVIYLIV